MTSEEWKNYIRLADSALASAGFKDEIFARAEVESIFASLGIIFLYTHMEQTLKLAIELKCNCCPDIEVRSFALSVRDKEAGRIKIDSMRQTLRRFGRPCDQRFREFLEDCNGKETWDSIVNNRNSIAHAGERSSMSFREVHGCYSSIQKVLGCFCAAIGLNENQASRVGKDICLPDIDL
jgi:hypothetical protein